MNDRAVSILEQYDFSVERTWKGRGAILFEADGIIYILKEYKGASDRLSFIADRLIKIKENGFSEIEEIVPNKEGSYFCTDYDRTTYIVKRYFGAKECNIREKQECLEAIQALGRLHKAMTGIVVGEPYKVDSLPLLYEIDKRNAELARVRKYLKSKGRKSEFELFLQANYDYFYENALAVAEQLAKEDTSGWCKKIEDEQTYSHGDYQYHNILMDETGCHIINFEKMAPDNPVKDLYFFMRKLLEKNNWDLVLGRELLHTYNEVRKLQEEDILQLKYRFLYPEKFRKIVNYYFNSSKSWISCKNTEKLESILQQEEDRNTLIQAIFD